MKKIFFINAFIIITCCSFSQEAMKIQGGGSIAIQNGAEVILQGGLTLDNGSSLLNNGTISLRNNTVANVSNWTDNSIIGALTGSGIVIFNSTHAQQFTGPTNFYTVYINTDDLTINNDLHIANLLRLIKGKVNTSNYVVALVNTGAASLENDATNTGYANSWINGNFKRSISTNTNSYDFPVGNSTRSNLLKFINNNITGPISLTSSFVPKAGTDAGLNVTENGNVYTAVNNGGVWKLIPNTAATGGNYALHLYFNGFTGLQDNRFGILRRPDASSNAADWMVPAGSLLESLNGTGRKVSDGFARRYNITDFSQFGIGEFNLGTPCEINGQSQVCIGSINNIYAAPPGMTTYFWTVTGAGISGSNTSQTLNVTVPNAPGTFTINLMTTLNGMASQCSKTVTITPTPACDIFGAGDLCVLSTNNNYAGPGNMTTYFWAASPGLQIVGSNTSSSINVNAITPGPQLITLNATWLSGCVSQCSKMINVSPLAPCSITGEANVTASTISNQYSAPGMSSYSWSISGNGTIVGSATGSSVNVTAGAAGSFTLLLTTTLNSCSTTCNKVVAVDPVFTYSCTITGSTETCSGTTEIFAAPPGLDDYEWNVTGDAVIDGLNTSATVHVISTGGGSYTISLQTMENGVPCSSQKSVMVVECVTACTYTQGFYSNPKAASCYNNSGIALSTSDQMQAAFGITGSKVFGNVANKRFFTLYRTDITNGNIFKMLPGGGQPDLIDVDNRPPFDGASYSDQGTWSLVPIQTNGPLKGRIRNVLLSQTITLWFNISNSSTLGSISLVDDTLVTRKTESCGSNTPIGDPTKFGIPHIVILYLNGGNGYAPTVEGLFQLANDVLGGVVTSISPSTINQAVDVINNAFDECRVLVGTIPYNTSFITQAGDYPKGAGNLLKPGVEEVSLNVIAYPNPYSKDFQLQINSSVSGMASIQFFTITGQKLYELRKPVMANLRTIVPYTGPTQVATITYRVTVGKKVSTGIVIKPN
jgi:hypothetical protein